jgi:hypothetical protein
MLNKKINKPCRPPCQRKQGKGGAKTMRGVPEIYEQKKRQFNVTLTPSSNFNP